MHDITHTHNFLTIKTPFPLWIVQKVASSISRGSGILRRNSRSDSFREKENGDVSGIGNTPGSLKRQRPSHVSVGINCLYEVIRNKYLCMSMFFVSFCMNEYVQVLCGV